MNCAPGDLAYIVGLDSRLGLNDRFVKLADSPAFLMFGVMHWLLEEVIETTLTHGGSNTITGEYFPAGSVGFVMEVPDENLRPIRHPGNDAVDQIVRLAGPAPMTAIEILAWSES